MHIVIAGGGTGGHLFPGVAVAEEFLARSDDNKVTFVGTENGIEAREIPKLGYPLELVKVSGIKTVGLFGALRGLLRIPGALWRSRKMLKRLRPDAVVGVGGYASGPAVLMARWLGIRTAILEQNSIPGLTNKILAKVTHRCFLSFAQSQEFFPDKKSVLVGNPIRASICKRLEQERQERTQKDKLSLFVFGGSQGARAVNHLVIAAAVELDKRGVPFDLVHQAGSLDYAATKQAYQDAGLEVDCREFIDDMASEYAKADLIIARSGATTVAELGIVGVPAILIPFPHAANNHQELNAKALVDSGAALLFRQSQLTGGALADAIEKLSLEPGALASMAEAMRATGHPSAARDVVDWCSNDASR